MLKMMVKKLIAILRKLFFYLTGLWLTLYMLGNVLRFICSQQNEYQTHHQSFDCLDPDQDRCLVEPEAGSDSNPFARF